MNSVENPVLSPSAQASQLPAEFLNVELFKIASGYKPSPDTTGELTAILKIVLGMTTKERTALLAYLKRK